ncbi:sensor histidine kinase [Flavobacterium chungbukense]|uniref:histidine kinase n=1 Tax=Flavobacterium chungbukense TaxID=877464 RepID=A0ABP7XMU4_9FLAO|nr:PAS domain-containing sensor histidine kinase [Flavobacterium chungbukense]MCC4920688.1 PAS domain-containing sensor histidine kinase [Flavobacterium chungbukense]
MKEIVKINLDNEMDLILAHKRSMKIAEMCGMPLPAQTRFSTAVSEVSRCSIAHGKNSVLVLGINVIKLNQKEILAVLSDSVDLKKCNPEAYKYAAKISGNIDYNYTHKQFVTTLSHQVPSPGLLSDAKIKTLADYFKYEPPISAYDEIRKKNIELVTLSEKLGESENRYRKLVDTIPVLICIVNDRNSVVLSNNALESFLTAPFIIFDKKNISTFIHNDDVSLLIEGWAKAKKDRKDFWAEIRIKKDDSYIWHNVSIMPNKAEDGSINSWLIYFVNNNAQKMIVEALKDNSELKEIQHELQDTNSKLKFKNKELEQFAFIASHDLQEPLRKIMIMLSRAAEHLTEEQKTLYYFDKISSSAGRLSNLISDVLNYSRINNYEKFVSKVDLNDVVMQTLDDLSMIIEEKNAVVNVSSLPTVNGLEAQLRQLFYNLINNGLKFNTSVPSITIACREISELSDRSFDSDAPSGNFNLISITDNGIGMSDEYSDRIFNMFQRLHQRDQYGGNGIGLALCRRIIENHNGVINFTSFPDQGTTFWIYLPK